MIQACHSDRQEVADIVRRLRTIAVHSLARMYLIRNGDFSPFDCEETAMVTSREACFAVSRCRAG